ncbi:unannotated protein [freshwater metagenome]|uniref:Unannotated protein n=1 Tax=freshwater metagenome TaxID=449393 RepID=A0A6J6RDS0_9ZZZZ
MRGDDLREVGGDDGGPVDDGGAGQLGLAAQLRGDPLRVQAEDRLAGRLAGQRAEEVADREHGAGRRLAAGDLDVEEFDDVGARGQVHVVAGAHQRHDHPDLAGDLATQRLDPLQQVATRARVDEIDDVGAQLETERIDLDLLGEHLRQVVGRSGSGEGERLVAAGGRSARGDRLLGAAREQQHHAAAEQEGDLRQTGDQAQRHRGEARDPQRQPVGGDLTDDVGSHVALARAPGDHQAGGDGEQQRRDLGDQTVADGEQGVRRHSVAGGHAALRHADREAADEVDQRDDDGGDRVALDELRGTVHRAVEVGLGVHLRPSASCLVLVDQPGVEVGVDRHLLARHGVEGEAGADLGDPSRAVRDDDELDDQQDREDDQTDDQRPADHEVAEGVDHAAGVAVDEHEPGGADVEREAEERHHQQDGGERREVERLHDEHGDQQDQQRPGDVGGDQQVEHHRRERDDQHHHDEDDADRDPELGQALESHRASGRSSVVTPSVAWATPSWRHQPLSARGHRT